MYFLKISATRRLAEFSPDQEINTLTSLLYQEPQGGEKL